MEKGWSIFTGVASVVTVAGLSFMGYMVVGATQTANVEPISFNLPIVQKVSAATTDYVPPTPVVDEEPIEVVEENLETTNILLLGVDARGDELTGRTDTMIVLQLDKKNDKTTMLSIPRDSYVNIVGEGKQDKITHAYAFGGLETATDTVEELLDIEIDQHLVLNFSSFISVVDKLGGINVDVPFAFSEQNSKGVKNAIKLEEGLQTLDGEQALAFARMRKQDPRGDIGRGERQQQVITAVVDKLVSFGSIPKYGKVYNEVSGSIDTSVGFLDIPRLAPYLTTLGEVESLSLDGKGIKIGGVYYYQLNETTLESVKQSFKD